MYKGCPQPRRACARSIRQMRPGNPWTPRLWPWAVRGSRLVLSRLRAGPPHRYESRQRPESLVGLVAATDGRADGLVAFGAPAPAAQYRYHSAVRRTWASVTCAGCRCAHARTHACQGARAAARGGANPVLLREAGWGGTRG
eukprot:scaffold1947_cov207-Prasinococcus_capsulatus_cf.AAC.37